MLNHDKTQMSMRETSKMFYATEWALLLQKCLKIVFCNMRLPILKVYPLSSCWSYS